MTKTEGSLEKYYKILRLEPGAGPDELKKAYKNRVKAWHPDKLPSASKRLQKLAHDKLAAIKVAHRALGKHIRAEAKKTGGKAPDIKGPQVKTAPANAPASIPAPAPRAKDPVQQKAAAMPARPPGNAFTTLANGDRYAGDVVDNKPHGEGIYIFSAGNQYVGEFKKGKPHGVGEFTFASGDKYTGQFIEDSMEGQGVYHYANGDKYTGQFKGGQPHGEGAYTAASGKHVKGVWENGFLKTEK